MPPIQAQLGREFQNIIQVSQKGISSRISQISQVSRRAASFCFFKPLENLHFSHNCAENSKKIHIFVLYYSLYLIFVIPQKRVPKNSPCGSPWFEWLSSPWFIVYNFSPLRMVPFIQAGGGQQLVIGRIFGSNQKFFKVIQKLN